MRVLVLGYGNHSKKRIIPALKSIEEIEEIVIGDKHQSDVGFEPHNIKIENFDQVFNTDDIFDLTIIATPPTNHIESILKSKKISKKILVEKPLTNSFDFIEKSIDDLFDEIPIYESLMYLHHPLWFQLKNIIENRSINKIYCEFSVPHISKDNYRYLKKLGGGSLLDQGIYPISLASELIDEKYTIENVETNFQKNYQVDLGGKTEILIDDSIKFYGKWGLGQDYSNYITLFGEDEFRIDSEFFFTKPDDQESFYNIYNLEEKQTINIGIVNQFKQMYLDALIGNESSFTYSSIKNIKKRYEIVKKIYDITYQ